MPIPTLSRLSFSALAMCCFIASAQQAQDGPRVPYPNDYRSWAVVKTSLVGPQSKVFAARGGFHHFYANDKAMEGYRTGSFPDGSVIVDEGVYAEEKDGVTREGARRSVEVMHKDTRTFRDNGGWSFDRFDQDKLVSETTAAARNACATCHASRKEKDYVFSSFRK